MFQLFKSRHRGSPAAEALCRSLETQLARASQQRLAEAGKAIATLPAGWEQTLGDHLAFVTKAGKVRAGIRRELAGATAPVPANADRLCLQASAPFLCECHRYLHHGAEGNERMMLISGMITPDGTRVLSKIEPVAYTSQSPGYVQLDPAATHRQLVKLCEADGCELHAAFHSHVMHGAASTTPSSVDRAAMQRFVDQGWDAIGGIFSLDGFVRLFSSKLDFDFLIYGNGAAIVENRPREKIVKLAIEGA